MRSNSISLFAALVIFAPAFAFAQGGVPTVEQENLTPLPGEVIVADPFDMGIEPAPVQEAAPVSNAPAAAPSPEETQPKRKALTEAEQAKKDAKLFFSKRNIARHGKYIWGGPYHNEVKVYLNDAKIPHTSQWDDEEWSPQEWIDARGGKALDVINGFYRGGLVADQYTDKGMAVLEVGQPFLQLSDIDKQRVVAFFDHVFGITRNDEAASIHVLYVEERYPLGIYDGRASVGFFTKSGLQLQ